jgi:hypothetical protein
MNTNSIIIILSIFLLIFAGFAYHFRSKLISTKSDLEDIKKSFEFYESASFPKLEEILMYASDPSQIPDDLARPSLNIANNLCDKYYQKVDANLPYEPLIKDHVENTCSVMYTAPIVAITDLKKNMNKRIDVISSLYITYLLKYETKDRQVISFDKVTKGVKIIDPSIATRFDLPVNEEMNKETLAVAVFNYVGKIILKSECKKIYRISNIN